MEQILIHQALFGYRDGHRLLGASRPLPPDAARTLHILSDRSGPRLQPEFDGYLTGTPLPDVPVYALCRTWDAPEMSRPGCVYTHTLLIDWVDLARLPDLRCLATFFRRPADGEQESYLQPIELVPEPVSADPAPWTAVQAGALLRALYLNPDQSLVLPAERCGEWEVLVLAVWSQMWPRLRRHFRFSTGSMSLRGQARHGFDLHVIPRSAMRRMHGEAVERYWLDLHVPPEPPGDDWLIAAVEDLPLAIRTPLRTFLVQHGSDVEPLRGLFPLLVRAYRFQRRSSQELQREELIDLVDEIGCTFPSLHEARHLKQALLGPRSPKDARAERWLLEALAVVAPQEAFDFDSLELPRRARDLFIDARPEAIELTASLALASARSAVGDRVLTLCAQEITVTDVDVLERTHPGALSVLIERNVRLAVLPAAWRRPAADQQATLRTLARFADEQPEFVDQALRAAIMHGSADLTEVACTLNPPAAVDAALAVGASQALPAAWRDALRRRPQVLLERVRDCRASALGQALSLLSPYDAAVRACPRELWLALIRQQGGTGIDRLALNVFVLTVGLQEPSGCVLCEQTFTMVWEALDRFGLNEGLWHQIEPVLPRLPSFAELSSTRKEKLARGLIAAFERHRWPLQAFLDVLRSPRVLDGVRNEVHSILSPSGFIIRIKDEVEAGRLTATEDQWQVIRYWRRSLLK